eukprot:4212766-Pleurochrysis_carterae.AAC.1
MTPQQASRSVSRDARRRQAPRRRPPARPSAPAASAAAHTGPGSAASRCATLRLPSRCIRPSCVQLQRRTQRA